VIYLSGLELRVTHSEHGGISSTVEELHVISAGGAGRQQVRLLHWVTGQPADLPNDQLRGSLDNQIGSSLLELDQRAEILTLEEYYPFGGTAVWSGKTVSETQYKFVRYSGQERDATGLYYYGFRYYAPWLGRWLNPDPAGTIDGLNVYAMVANNPISSSDTNGLMRLEGYPYKDYQHALEKHFAKYMKPHIVSRKEHDKERALQKVGAQFNLSGQPLGETVESMITYISAAPLTVNFKLEALPSFSGTYLKNSWFASSTRAMSDNYKEKRQEAEFTMLDVQGRLNDAQVKGENFGIKYGDHGRFIEETLGARPTYGALQLSGTPSLRGGAPMYGSGAFRIHNTVKEYVTYTSSDSLILLSDGSMTMSQLRGAMATQENLYPLLSFTRRDQRAYIKEAAVAGGAENEMPYYFEWQAYTSILFGGDIVAMAANPQEAMSGDIINALGSFSTSHGIDWLDEVAAPKKTGLLSRFKR
jgi:insecticidal toxin complex protein TccC